MLNITFIMMISLIIPIIIISLNFTLSMMKTKSREKMTPFECGFDPLTNSRLPFSIQFFTISLLFLIFDIEIILIIPFINLLKFSMLTTISITITMIIIVLILGLWMEWKFNYLKWIN